MHIDHIRCLVRIHDILGALPHRLKEILALDRLVPDESNNRDESSGSTEIQNFSKFHEERDVLERRKELSEKSKRRGQTNYYVSMFGNAWIVICFTKIWIQLFFIM